MNKKFFITFLKIFIYLLLFFLLILTFCSKWVLSNFGHVRIDSILFTLLSPMDGTDYTMIISWFLTVLLPSFLLTLFAFLLILFINKKYKPLFSKRGIRTYRIIRCILSFTIVISLVLCCVRINSTFGILKYFSNGQESTKIYKQRENTKKITDDTIIYQNPEDVSITGNSTNNLIYIYLESMENSFMDVEHGGINSNNSIPELTTLANDNVSFSNTDKIGGAMAFSGLTWTIGSMVGQSTGLPLKVSLGNDTDKLDKFMPGAKSIGDVLHEKGYYQELLLGSNSNFAGTNNFFMQHGFDSIVDYSSISNKYNVKNNEKCDWGVKDHFLLDVAKDELSEISKNNKNFNLTICTIDTHGPHGFQCSYCPNTYDDPYQNVYACQSKLINEFVNWCKTQSWYKNTTIVLVGDHNTMASKHTGFIPDDYERTTYNCFINAKIKTKFLKNRKFTQMDMYPTTLAAIGFKIEGNKLGLGTNLFSGTKTLIEKYGKTYIENEVQKSSEYLDKNIYQIE